MKEIHTEDPSEYDPRTLRDRVTELEERIAQLERRQQTLAAGGRTGPPTPRWMGGN